MLLHIKKNLKQVLNHGLLLKKVHKVNKFNQIDCLKPYMDVNTDLRKKAKDDFGKDLFKLMNNTVFGKKTMENLRRHRDIKIITTGRWRTYLVSEPNYHTTKCSAEHLLPKEMKKTQTLMNKSVYLGLLILE